MQPLLTEPQVRIIEIRKIKRFMGGWMEGQRCEERREKEGRTEEGERGGVGVVAGSEGGKGSRQL